MPRNLPEQESHVTPNDSPHYSQAVLDHFHHPRNVGRIAGHDGLGRIGHDGCGDVVEVTIKVVDNVLADVKFLARGCPTAIACSSAMTELAIGLDLDTAAELTDDAVEDALGGLPDDKRHCSNLAVSALVEAIIDHIHRPLRQIAQARSNACD